MVASTARVSLWGQSVGALVWDEEKRLGSFEYFPEFISTGLEISSADDAVKRWHHLLISRSQS